VHAATGLPALADPGYDGAGIGIHIPVRQPAGSQELDVNTRTRNALQRSLRCLGERGFALLTGRWRTLRHITVPVLIDRIDVTLNEAAEVLHGRSYVAGRWECPHHCNPRTGQRMHYGQEFRTGASLAGTECACSCGDKTVVLDEAERAVWPPCISRPGDRGQAYADP